MGLCAPSHPQGEVTIEGGSRGRQRSHKLSFSLATEWRGAFAKLTAQLWITFPSKITLLLLQAGFVYSPNKKVFISIHTVK